jgi:hypothetical protein
MFVQKLQWHVLSAKSATTSHAKIVATTQIGLSLRSFAQGANLHNFIAKLDN